MTWGAFFYNFQGWTYVLALLSMIVSLVVYGLVRDDEKEGNENSVGAKKRKRCLWVMCSMSVVFLVTMFGSCFYAQHIEKKALTLKSNEIVKDKKIPASGTDLFSSKRSRLIDIIKTRMIRIRIF